jgi:hypothetical protein
MLYVNYCGLKIYQYWQYARHFFLLRDAICMDMGILGQLERALGVWYPDPDEEPDDTNPVLALAFREYVLRCLEGDFSVTDREDRETGEPDALAVRNSNGTRFDLITCYRSRMFTDADGGAYLPWVTEETYATYLAYEEQEENPVYVIIGLHGFADEPKFLFSIPLRDAVPRLPRSGLRKYERKNPCDLLPLW